MEIGIKPCYETNGKERIRKKFAWLPTTLSDNTIIIWETYKILEVVEEQKGWNDNAYHGYGASYLNGTFSWVIKKKYK